MSLKKIKDYNNYWIHSDGYVLKIYSGKEIIIPIKIQKKVPKIRLGNKHYNFIFLMLEYFGEKTISHEEFIQCRFKYKLIDGKIAFDSINLIKYNSNEHDDVRMFMFKCREKSISANSRVSNISTISPSDVFDSLLRTDFKCTYCNTNLNRDTWELDHVAPLSKTGLNISTNITPACKKCNRMKSDIEIVAFIHLCKKISNNFSDSTYITGASFKQNNIKS